MNDINTTNTAIIFSPKVFQKKTIDRVCNRFKNKIHKVLVADEVGLGKTIIAQGVIKKMSEYFYSNPNNKNKPFRVIYICSNQIIARQNIKKLDLDKTYKSEDTRLSFQSLKLHEAEISKQYDGKIQVIPLTPHTSFITKSQGLKEERAYIHAVLKKLQIGNLDFLKTNNISNAKSWDNDCNNYYEKIDNDLLQKIKKSIKKEDLQKQLKEKDDFDKIIFLRKRFADLGILMLKPDLVIMDEFQRFKELLDSKNDKSLSSETAMLTQEFFNNKNMDILLLSATPYKMYSTNQEIDSGLFNHKTEFDSVMKFLLEDNYGRFNNLWNTYTEKLNNIDFYSFEEIKTAKKKVENIMYENICRTERNFVMDDSKFVTENITPMVVKKYDVDSYKAIAELIKKVNVKDFLLNVDFVKSAPFLLSFMQDYELKKQLFNKLQDNSENIKFADNKYLWIDEELIKSYKPIPITNSKYEKLINCIFNKKSNLENLLWIPPSRPYYKMENAFSICNDEEYKKDPISKYLIFSAWEMVPRMISTLVSYEAERLVRNEKDTREYSKEYRPRFLNFMAASEKPYLFTLLYPSKYLANLYNPVDYLDFTLDEIKESIAKQIEQKLKDLKLSTVESGKRGELGWYSMLPMYIDNHNKSTLSSDTHYKKWIDQIAQINNKKIDENNEDSLYKSHLTEIKLDEKWQQLHPNMLPEDIVTVLTDMVLGSPAVCIYRNIRDDSCLDYITETANRFCRYFNSPEAVFTVKHVYDLSLFDEDDEETQDKKENKVLYWKYILKYCEEGCFQSMFDEFYDLQNGKNNTSKLKDVIEALLPVKTRYIVDTYPSFVKKIKSNTDDVEKQLRIESHFAVSFTKGRSNDKDTNRKDKVRNAFNSPIRPFVLSTTSIGQEGLDFHYYCRKIIHWNLPSNPVDLEQREGRINRYKCLAVRQSIAKEFGNQIDIKKRDIITQLNNLAQASKPKDKTDLYPFWVLGNKQSVQIERMLFQYPLSIDDPNYKKLKQVLSLYRLTIGQPNQEELIEYFEKKGIKDKINLKELTINLSPSY